LFDRYGVGARELTVDLHNGRRDIRNWSMGRVSIQIAPAITNTIDTTIAVTGRFINVFAIIEI